MAKELKLMKGNEAIAQAMIASGCDGYFGYPITPQSEVMETLMAEKPWETTGMVVLQAESEVASINMVYGGAATGKKVATSSSSPGISLMQEGFTFLAGAELPAVIVDIMRAGPGLGNIGPEQGDYNQIVKGGGHGNYKNIVLAPNSVQEMCDLTMKAFELADKWRNPVVVLADGTLGQMAEPLVFPEKAIEPKNDKPWAVKGNAETMDNLITSIYNDFNDLEDFNFKLQEKYAQIEAEEVIYDEYQVDDADIVLVSFGISSRIARSAVDKSREKGVKVGLLRPITLSPFPVDRVKELADKGVSFISVEMSNGQLLADVQFAALRKDDTHLVNRMGGNLIELKHILAKIYEIAGIDDDDIDLSERSEEKASPNIID